MSSELGGIELNDTIDVVDFHVEPAVASASTVVEIQEGQEVPCACEECNPGCQEKWITKKVKVQTVCEPPAHGKVAHYDGAVDGVPPNDQMDILNITYAPIRESGQMALQRARRWDMRFIYSAIAILNIIFLVSCIFGVTSDWYKNLRKDNVSPYLLGSLWLVAAVLAYGGIFMLWEHVEPNQVSRDIRVSIWFLIGTFLSVLWAGVFFQGHNLQWALWIAAVLFLYSFWLLIDVWIMKPTAGVFLLPLVVMYGYFFYASVHVCFLNNAPV